MSNSILILTNNAGDFSTLKQTLSVRTTKPFEVEWIPYLSVAVDRLSKGNIDAVLLDLTLADSQGLETFDAIFAVAKKVTIITLCGTDDNPLAIATIARGAQATLSRSNFSSIYLPQALRNIVHRNGIELSLNQEKWRARLALNSIADAVICIDSNGIVNYLNDAAVRVTGWVREVAYGTSLNEVFKIMNGTTRILENNTAQLVLQKNRIVVLPPDTILIRFDKEEVYIEDSASPIHDDDDNVAGVVIVFRDVTSHRMQEKKMAHLAQHDFLTDLPNRVLLDDRIIQAIAIAERNKKNIALLFLDLDNFKYINDSLGHPIGDDLLKSVAQRLVSCVRSSDTVCRQGGDEFIVLLADGTKEEEAAITAQKILNVIATVHAIEAHQLFVTTSIGISVYPADGEDAETLLKNADTAMYHAKEDGRNNFQFFRRAMNMRSVERQLIESHLRTSIERHELVLYYQPKVNLATGEVSGAEALLRWDHPEWGMILPDRFIEVAEDSGLIIPIGNWVLR
jgi:diguanylate cyclase (GGDEF)-like protein/PAS domain S-box-containing protein